MKKIQSFSIFQNYTLVNESIYELSAEDKTRKRLKELIFKNQDDEDIESLLLNMRDYGFDVTINRKVYSWESKQHSSGTQFIKSIAETLDDDDYAIWQIKIWGPFETPVEVLGFIHEQFKRIKKRCKEFTIDSIETISTGDPRKFNKFLKVFISIKLEPEFENIEIKKILQDLKDEVITEHHKYYLKCVASLFGGEKATTKLTKILGKTHISVLMDLNFLRRNLESQGIVKLSNKIKRSIFDLDDDNNRMFFTYDVRDSNEILDSIDNVKKILKTTHEGKFSIQSIDNYILNLFEVIIHTKSENTYDFKFKEDETLALELTFNNLDTQEEGKYPQAIQKIIDNLK
jgi:hypothetical protein